jgi:hypothetical protein
MLPELQTTAQIKNALELYYSDNKTYPAVVANNAIPMTALAPYLKSTNSNFAITGGTQPMYLSNGTNYELIVPMETGGSFARNNGCFAGDATSIPNSYCSGNNPSASIPMTGSITFRVVQNNTGELYYNYTPTLGTVTFSSPTSNITTLTNNPFTVSASYGQYIITGISITDSLLPPGTSNYNFFLSSSNPNQTVIITAED